MIILLVNDDGYSAEGLGVLAEHLKRCGHTLYICAPDSQRSAASHSITIGEVECTKAGDNRWLCSGTPADCVLYSLSSSLFPQKPDLVISGINHGYNLCNDIVYSATLGAACEASILGYPAIAVSCSARDGVYPFETAARFLSSRLEEFRSLAVPFSSYLSVNVPPESDGQRWKLCSAGIVDYHDRFEIAGNSDKVKITLQAQQIQLTQGDEWCDWRCVHSSIISVSNLCCYPSPYSPESC